MDFDFWTFYDGLLKGADEFSLGYWDQFPEGRLLRFKSETLPLLKRAVEERDAEALDIALAIIWYDGADHDYTDILLRLLDENWHIALETIIQVLEVARDPVSIEKLYEVAVDVPDYDDMRAVAIKCMWALSAINTPEAIEKLKLLQGSDDLIISENATFQLEEVVKKS